MGASPPCPHAAIPIAAAPAAADVTINPTNFPDATFRDHVKTNWDANSDGKLSVGEIAAVVSADVHSKDIQNLKGIEHFTALKELYCFSNPLTALDVSKNAKLVNLYCYANPLTALDVSENKKLKSLYCQGNRLTFLDLGRLDELVPATVDVGGQTRDGLKVLKIGSKYVVDLGEFLLSADRFGRVNDLAGKAGSTDLPARYDFVSGKARFSALPDTVTYRYLTGKDPLSMDVRLTTELVSPDVPSTPPSGPDVPSTPPSDPDVPPVTSPVSPESSSGGGCTAGLGSAVLLALIPLAVRRRR